MSHFSEPNPTLHLDPTQLTKAFTQPNLIYGRHSSWPETKTLNDQTKTLAVRKYVSTASVHMFHEKTVPKQFHVSFLHSIYFHSGPALVPHLRSSTDSSLFADSADLASVTAVRPTNDKSPPVRLC